MYDGAEALEPQHRLIWLQNLYRKEGTVKTGNKNEQIILRQCRKTSWIAILRVLPPSNQTYLATN